MRHDAEENFKTKIGDRTYFGAEFRNPELQELILQWQDIGWDKFAGPEELTERPPLGYQE